jgi:hypothetical protein
VAAVLEQRRAEIEDMIMTRALAVSAGSGSESPGYLQGLRGAVAAAVDLAIAAVERGIESAGPLPIAALAQARQAARHQVGLEVVLRRYAVGYSSVTDVLQVEAARLGVGGETLHAMQRQLTALFDRLVEAVSEEYTSERRALGRDPKVRHLELVRRILARELVDTGLLGYEFGAWHQAVVAFGPGAAAAVRELAGPLDRRLLLVEVDERSCWAWLAGREPEEVPAAAGRGAEGRQTTLSLGEPGPGIDGWRRSHRQAQAALRFALDAGSRLVRYGEVGLLAAISRDDDLTAYLRDRYLRPLDSAQSGGEALRDTLVAYFEAGRNISAAAASLGVARQTVASRLQTVERSIDRPLSSCGAELEAILRLERN